MDSEDLDETVLDVSQRIKRGNIMRRNSRKLQRAKEIAQKKTAPKERLMKRAYAQARQMVRKRFAGPHGADYENLSTSEKIAVDRTIDNKQKLIKKLALRLMPRIRQAEQKRLQSFYAGSKLQNHGATESGGKTATMTESLNETFAEAFGSKTSKKQNLIKILNRLDDKTTTSLSKKSEKSGVCMENLAEVFTRGLDSWNEDTNLTPRQYAFARVNSFINMGTTYFTEDSDLVESIDHKKLKKGQEVFLKVQNKPSSPSSGRVHSVTDSHILLKTSTGPRLYKVPHANATIDYKESWLANGRGYREKLSEGYKIRSKGFEHVEVVHNGKTVAKFKDPHSARLHIAKLTKQVTESKNTPYVRPHIEDGKTEQSAWKASNKHGRVKYFRIQSKDAALKHAGLTEETLDEAFSKKIKDHLVPRGAEAKHPLDPQSKLAKHHEIKKKIIDESEDLDEISLAMTKRYVDRGSESADNLLKKTIKGHELADKFRSKGDWASKSSAVKSTLDAEKSGKKFDRRMKFLDKASDKLNEARTTFRGLHKPIKDHPHQDFLDKAESIMKDESHLKSSDKITQNPVGHTSHEWIQSTGKKSEKSHNIQRNVSHAGRIMTGPDTNLPEKYDNQKIDKIKSLAKKHGFVETEHSHILKHPDTNATLNLHRHHKGWNANDRFGQFHLRTPYSHFEKDKSPIKEEVKTSDKEPVVVPAHKDAYDNTIPAKTILRKTARKIIKSGNVHNGEST